MPAHAHSINHNHGNVLSGNQNVNHTHTFTTNAAGPTTHMIDGAPMGNGMAWSTGAPAAHRIPEAPSTSNGVYVSFTDVDPHPTHQHSGTTDGQSANHQHNVAIPPYTGSSGSAGSGQPHENMPPYVVTRWVVVAR